ncbi:MULTISPECIES: thioredoxin domain-containing protein [unclassified Moorena]|uniref:DsbA family protein n=1 Tax=unclassified Moorena TaxID=2683338 RepID=UPI00140196EA|nr:MULTISPECIES: thioredoxin domain-containing protein [unclassified Moorena]NEO17389.1 thioredoxin domain-containing protein [Moorena sp. SIO3E8]NEQ03946.1 thioredoxin domain-containing protein [Moorena sp. SIO3F7]
MKQLYRISITIVSLFLCLVTLSSCSNNLANTDQLEGQVLSIIRNNPEVILESVQAYQQEKQQELAQSRQAFLQQMMTQPTSIIGNSPTTGVAENQVVLLEFSDFQCPFCAEANQSVKDFMDKHSDQVTLVYKHLPLTQIHPQALPAAKAAWAAFQQGKFWEYEDALFEQQDNLDEELYVAIAQDINLDLEQFNRDRISVGAEAAIRDDLKLAQTLAVNGTPFFVFNTEVLQVPLNLSEMESILAQVRS